MSRRRTYTVALPSVQWPVLALDPTGETIPAHFYAPPVGTSVYMSPTAGSGGNGTFGSPYGTLNHAIDNANDGDTVVMIGGTYSDSYTLNGGIVNDKYLTFQPYEDDDVIFDGHDSLQYMLAAAATSGLGTGTHTFQGFCIQNYHSDEGTILKVPLYLSDGDGAAKHIVDKMLLRNNYGCALNLNDPRPGTQLTRSIIRNNGAQGVNVRGSGNDLYPTTWAHPNNLFVAHNLFQLNCWNPVYNVDPQMAGLKALRMDGATFFGNIAEYNDSTKAHGIWTDEEDRRILYLCNFARGNGSAGFFQEVAYDAHFISNISVDNGQARGHANFRTTSYGSRFIHNTSVGGWGPIEIYDDPRTTTSGNVHVPDAGAISMYGNLFAGPHHGIANPSWMIFLYKQAGAQTNPETFFDSPGQWGQNAWYRGGVANIALLQGGTKAGSYTMSTLRSQLGLGLNDLDLTSSPFTNPAAGDYRVLFGSPAHGAGPAIPADVAAMVAAVPGAPAILAGARYDDGFIECPVPTWAKPTRP